MTIGGSVREFSIAGRSFAVAADADVNMKLGGSENETQANGNGTSRRLQTVTPWSLDGLVLTIDDDAGDLEFLQDLANDGGDEAVTITYASGEVYQGSGAPEGEIAKASQATTAAVKFAGPGALTKQ